jgi:hypothetical protein
VAVRDRSIDAALSLRNREAIADPFRPTAELVELLRIRARALAGPGDPRGTMVPRGRPRTVTA